MYLTDKELGRRVCKWSEKNKIRRQSESSMDFRDEKISESLLKMARGNCYELRVK